MASGPNKGVLVHVEMLTSLGSAGANVVVSPVPGCVRCHVVVPVGDGLADLVNTLLDA